MRSQVLLLALALAGCKAEKFVAPDKPDLYKVPYDFAPTGDLAGADFSHLPEADQSVAHDLASDDDLSATHPDDLAHEEHD